MRAVDVGVDGNKNKDMKVRLEKEMRVAQRQRGR